jgi:hypothetical protein
MTEPMTTADVTQRYNPEKAMLCISTLGQFVGLGSDDAALVNAMSQPPIKKISAVRAGRNLVWRSAARQLAVSSYIWRMLCSKLGRFRSRKLQGRGVRNGFGIQQFWIDLLFFIDLNSLLTLPTVIIGHGDNR